ncbi:unnamed protein product [Allacma fusca]|uniref:Partial AB-hydrolase lipase domain-containing protein n=1 Tax=Allacma fusca TaxID=39272 RepID=A0A8J2PZM6_9HEXA|nr:unnamed protein product [Allacma fusca]
MMIYTVMFGFIKIGAGKMEVAFVVLLLAAVHSTNCLPGLGSSIRSNLNPKTLQSPDGSSTSSRTPSIISNCDVNPPAPNPEQDGFSAPEIIHAAGYPNETHQVTTSDGYILTMHRIRKDGGIPILLMHGILCSSRDWLMQRGNNSLPYQLWLAGYDVWMGNMRGNNYSLSHETIPDPINNPAFWDFSFDQIAQKDYPTSIDYVLSSTNNTELQCLGYSLGTTTLIAGLIRLPEYQKKCKCFTGLAPVTTNGNITSIALKGPAEFPLPEEPL